MVPDIESSEHVQQLQQKAAATKYHDEFTEIFKTRGIEIPLVSGRVLIFSSFKEVGYGCSKLVPKPHTKLIAAQLRTFYAISLAIGQLPTYQCFEGRLEFFTASVPTICFSILGTT